jgi:AcrR family transcriptional regulator
LVIVQTEEFTEARKAIIAKAELLFMRFGLKSVSMDDVTRELGISKKTLYQYFQSKEDLVLLTIQQHQNDQKKSLAHILKHSGDALQEMFGFARHFIVQLRQMSPATIFDLKKYYPDIWHLVQQSQREYIYDILVKNMSRGKMEGLYRTNLHDDILARLYLGSVLLLLDDSFFPNQNYHWDKLYREFIEYHLRGIASSEGLEKLQDYLNEL